MAHAARILELTDGLVRSVAGDRSQHASFLRMRDQASKTFRNTTHARTNQFDIRSRLTGLVEKFAVLNRDDLADALQRRLEDLPRESKWMPEILSLLLQLSDRPLEKTNIDDVEAVSKPVDEQAGLTWDEIIADDPLDESGVWDNIERGYHSSGDDATVDGNAGSDDSNVTQATSAEDDTIELARLHIVRPEEQLLDDLQTVGDGSASPIPELSLIRETLSMLHGLPTQVYQIHQPAGEISIRRAPDLETAAKSTTNNLVFRLAETGTGLNRLRQWAKKPEDTPNLQSCQAATISVLMAFDRQISAIERRYAAPVKDSVVSLVSLRSEVEIAAKPLLHLSRIVKATEIRTDTSHFALFDALYDNICVNELSGDDAHSKLAHVFLSGLKTYLKPLSLWVQAGTLDRDDKTSMIVEADPECEYSRLWHDRFALRTLPDGGVCSPRFMHHLATKIFAVGKSRAFLRALGGCEDVSFCTKESGTHAINVLRDSLGTTQLLPFSQLLDDSLESWIEDTGRDSTPILHQKLLHDHGLLRTTDRLEEVFCSKNGIHFQAFAEALFWRMDHQPNGWNNSFVLSELAQSTLGSDTDMESLTVRVLEVEESTQPQSSIKKLGSLILETTFSWQVQNITCSRTSTSHAKVFTFLLQTHRARCLLQSHVLDLKHFGCRANEATSAVQLALRLRQRLICLIDILHKYIATTAHTLHASLKKELTASSGIDAMAAVWTTHTKQMDTALLLAQKFSSIRESIIACLGLCEQFAPRWVRLVDSDILAKSISEDGVEENEREKDPASPPAKPDFVSMGVELDRSLSFILAGVRSIGRASGNKMLEELAERLEWMAQ